MQFEGFVKLSNSGELCWCSCSSSWVVVVFRIPKIFCFVPQFRWEVSVDSCHQFGTVENSSCLICFENLNITTCHAVAIASKRIGLKHDKKNDHNNNSKTSQIFLFFPSKAWFCCQYFWGENGYPEMHLKCTRFRRNWWDQCLRINVCYTNS